MTVYKLFTYIGIIALVLTALRYWLNDNKKVLVSFLQNFVGTLFIFSGFVKAVDPMGTSFKMHEYFEAMHIEFLNPTSTAMSVAMLVAELTIGVALLIGWWPKLTTSLLLLLNVFFLLLTGFTFLSGYEPTTVFFVVSILAFALICIGVIVENEKIKMPLIIGGLAMVGVSLLLMKFSNLLLTAPFSETKMKVTDCGCFGDFMKLKPWQTFYKDCILTFFAFVIALRYTDIKPIMSGTVRSAITGVVAAGSLIFCLYNFMWDEPMIDFRPYAIGSDLNKNRIPARAEVKDYVFIYKNKTSGVVTEYKMADLSKVGENDTCIGRRDSVVVEGIPARISNLFIFNDDKEDITDDLLHDPNYSLVVVAYKLDKTCECCYGEHLNPLAAACDKAGIKFYALSSDNAEEFRHKHQTAYPFYQADETPLKTMMRSNPGLMLLKNGVVVNKWHRKHFPSFDELNKTYFSHR